MIYKGREGVAALKSFIWKSVFLNLALLQQSWWNSFHGPHGLGAGGVDERLGEEEAVVSCVPQLECKRIGDPVSVGPVYRAARTDICLKEKVNGVKNGLKPYFKADFNPRPPSSEKTNRGLEDQIRWNDPLDLSSRAFLIVIPVGFLGLLRRYKPLRQKQESAPHIIWG